MSHSSFVPDKADWVRFYRNMLGETGLDLHSYKPEQLRRRIVSLARAVKTQSLDEFWAYIAKNPARIQAFTDRLAINVSEFYRDPTKWQELVGVIQNLREESPNLKCWSAGCSFGAEAYTLGILLDVHFPAEHTILGTDIDSAALDQARRGEFSEAEMNGLPPEIRKFYFTHNRVKSNWHVKEKLARNTWFKEHNLLRDEFDAGYDLILCRNVTIYLQERAKVDLYRKFYEALRPGGYLFTGSAERIYDFMDYGFDSSMPFFYRKPLQRLVAV